ncbi:MAG TPA: (Fe-S)-binding protein [Bryobacteraceae bacterium]|jgi:L-lactate dehydrogenase complex protein LldE|nr:(Fe-S)-binding protein [Bryobacteraceae bacterium]
MRISLFVTCYNDLLFPETGKAVVAILERLGHEVDFPIAQTCCGQMHYNTGYQSDALTLMRRFVSVFREAEVVCVPSSSCVAMMRDHYLKLAAQASTPGLEADVKTLLPRIYEFSELLTDKLGVEDIGAFFPHEVVLHVSCHALRSLRLGDKPARLLRKVRGLTLVEPADGEDCCGFGGTFSVKNADVSAAILAAKIQGLLATGAEVCTAVDNSCLMHIGGALQRQRTAMRTLHLAEILATSQ